MNSRLFADFFIMSLEQNAYSVNIRESTQSAGTLVKDGRIENPFLPPPGHVIESSVASLIDRLPGNEEMWVELMMAPSCPSVIKMDQRLLRQAARLGVAGRTPLLTRLTEADYLLSRDAGAKAMHLFGNASEVAGDKAASIEGLLGTLDMIAQHAQQDGMLHLRAGLEHATQTPVEKLEQYYSGITDINRKYGQQIFTAVSLTDTNGAATPDQYEALISQVGGIIRKGNFSLFVHIHDDGGHGLVNTKTIIESARAQGIPVVVEATLDDFPGERVGLQPTIGTLPTIFPGITVPEMANNTIKGSSWKTEAKTAEDRELVCRIHVAGIHTANMDRYGGGIAHPGLYSIMGTVNITSNQLDVLGISPSQKEVAQAAALVGRELGAQKGGLPQAYSIALAHVTAEQPELIVDTATSMGPAREWLHRPVPDLRAVEEALGQEVKSRWGI